MEMETFAERLSHRMQELGVRQIDIVKATGKTSGAVSCWLKGAYLPKGDALKEIAKLLQTTPDWLLDGEGPKEALEAMDAMRMSSAATIGKNIKQRADELGLKPADIAKELDISRGAVSQWIKGQTKPSYENLIKLAKILRTNVDWLRFKQGPKEAVNITREVKPEDLSFSFIFKVLKKKTDKLPPDVRRAVAKMIAEAIVCDKEIDIPKYVETLLEEGEKQGEPDYILTH